MSESIKATCPGCRKLIRIPIEWSERAMKCKKCGTLVQMKKKDASPTTVETAVAPKAPTAVAPAYEPNYDAPAAPPQPAFTYPPPAPPQYPEAPAHPYGYPSPYPMPPQYAAPQAPGYGYPYPQPPAYAYPPQPQYAPAPQPAYNFGAPPPQAPAAEAAFPTNDDAPSPRRRYQRNAANGTQKIVILALAAVFVVGIAIVAMKMAGGTKDSGSQAKSDKGSAGKTPDPSPISIAPSPATPAPAITSDPFPRRLLFIHLSKYVYFNNLSAGVYGRGEDMPTRTANQMAYEFRVPTDPSNNQLFAFIDTGKPTPPALKSVLMQTFEQFFNTSREQDRIVIYFGGHAREIDGKAYLVPVDGEPEDASTLLPVEEVYAKLAACKAQQKVLLFDVCRFNPGYGAARAGSEPMSEKLAEALHKVPPGVQVLTSCSVGQNAQETSETGSEFLTAFRAKAKELKSSASLVQVPPGQPIPTERWADSLREYLAAKRDFAPPQTVKATVPIQDPSLAIAYKKEEPAAVHFAWPHAPPGANPGEVNAMLALIDLPGIRKEIELPAGLAQVYPFSADVMKEYAPDIPDEQSIKGDKYPLRKATADALSYIRDHWKFGTGEGMRESLNGSVDDNLKKEIAKDQIPIAKLTLQLEEHLGNLEAAGKKIGEEKSKRWLALHAYALAQIQMRWAFVQEYNLALGNIRTDSLEKPTGGGTPVYRLVSVEKMKSKKDITEKVESARDAFEKIAKDNKGTPLEIVAKMNRNVSLGLTWKLENQQEAMADDKMEKK